jgi:hypothetical protein
MILKSRRNVTTVTSALIIPTVVTSKLRYEKLQRLMLANHQRHGSNRRADLVGRAIHHPIPKALLDTASASGTML